MKWHLALGLAILQAGTDAARATPPDIIDLRDEIFGFSEQSIFLLRSTWDNLGVYSSEQREVFLVVVDRQSGAESLAPVYQVRRDEDQAREASGPGTTWWMTRAVVPAEAVNPWQVLAEARGVPYGAGGQGDSGPAPVEGSLAPGGEIHIGLETGWSWRGEGAVLVAGIGSRLDGIAAALGEPQRIAPVTVRDLLAGQVFTDQDCDIAGGQVLDRAAGGPPSALVRIDCVEGEGGQLASLLIVLPEAWRVAAAP
ncbi:hypothetical protein [Rhodobacter sp. 24-YEA-8]|uniref:hypothetical protein n=1 Tax=Rhodobacter sp. 24-YEA-8 TaxID=1884310 RepID=UPI000899EC16|nr:hypothetical protein [Rhodobacter sp. 24-YEA-8]SEB59229.1 hypothetical protein SAMN05519105_0856 [Rhodobacter sp. 24-YEA-8]